MMRRATVGVLAAMAIAGSVVSGCTRSVPRMPQPRPAGLLGVRPCPGITGFSCGSLSVRLDPSGGAPGQLSLRVAVADVAAAGQPGALRALMARVHAAEAVTAGELSQGLHASALCADMPMPWGGPGTPLAGRAAALARSVARLTTAQVWPFDKATAAGNGFIQTCLHWPPVPVPAAAAARPRLPRVPVLLLAGGHDLSTPLAGARAQAALAPGGHLFVVPAAGHSVQNRAAGNPAEAEVARFLAA